MPDPTEGAPASDDRPRYRWRDAEQDLFNPVNTSVWWTESNGVRLTWEQYNASPR